MKKRLTLAASGALLLLAFASLPSVSDGMRVVFRPPWDRVASEEAWLWLGTFFLLLPGCVALGLALGPQIQSTWEWVRTRAVALSSTERVQLAVLVCVLGAAIAQVLNAVVLRGLPVTDDEYAALLGGRIWASGRWSASLPPWFPAAPQLFLFSRGGTYTSFDFPGVIGAWALSQLTSSGTWIFSVLGGLGLGALAVLTTRRWGAATAVVAAALALASPHFTLISLSSHAHVLSRGFFGLGLATLLFVDAPSARRGFLGGVLLGLATLCRPFEVVVIVAPVVLGLVLDSLRARRFPFVFGLLGGLLVMAACFIAIDLGVGGSVLPLRMSPNDVVHPYGQMLKGPLDFSAWPARFGNNVTYNLVMSGVFLLGPIGLPLACWGATVDATHRRLALGALLGLFIGLLHDDRGIHALGPVHLSEASFVLLVLAVAGLRQLVDRCRQLGLGFSAALPAGYLAGLVVFTGFYAVAHARQAAVQQSAYELIEGQVTGPTVVLAPSYAAVRGTLDETKTGTWVYSWRRVDPLLEEAVVILHDSPQARAQVRSWFPERAVQVLEARDRAWNLVSLEAALPLKDSQGAWTPLRSP